MKKRDYVFYALVGTLCAMLIVLADLTAEKIANAIYPIPNIPKQERKAVLSIYEQISEITDGKNVDILYNLAKCESNLNVYAVGINDNGTYDRGFYQINNYWHPEVPDHCAFNFKCSTIWTNNMISNGQLHQWACADKI